MKAYGDGGDEMKSSSMLERDVVLSLGTTVTGTGL